jgi:hypothetical protein
VKLKLTYQLLFLAFFTRAAFAQEYKAPNYKKFDEKLLHFGFTLGMNSAGMLAIPNANLSAYPNLVKTEMKTNPGFNLGFIGSLKLGHPTLTLRFLPMLSFQAKEMRYFYQPDPNDSGPYEPEIETVESTLLDFPLLLKYKTLRYNNFSAYFIGGAQYSVDLQSKENVSQDVLDPFLKLRKHDFQAQIGAGVDFYLPYFKFGIEIKLSHGIRNSLIQDNTRLSLPFERLYNRVVWFSLTFEG